jgi:hypothetical protein
VLERAAARAGWDEYEKRLRRYHKVQVTRVSGRSQALESEAVRRAAGKSPLVLLDPRGQQFSSEALSAYLDAQALMQPASSRRAALSATHAFECTCTRCEAAERVAAELELHAARCARDGCKGLICLPPRAYRGAGDEDEDEDEDEDGEGRAAQRADLRCPACGATHEEAPLVRACRQVSRVLRSDASERSGAALVELEAAARLVAPLHPRHSARTDLERAIAMALVRDASEVAATSEATETGEAAATEGAAIAEAALGA